LQKNTFFIIQREFKSHWSNFSSDLIVNSIVNTQLLCSILTWCYLVCHVLTNMSCVLMDNIIKLSALYVLFIKKLQRLAANNSTDFIP
jgi:hypothetical protein